MGRLLKDGLVGLLVGIFGGIAAGILLAPKRRQAAAFGPPVESGGRAIDSVLDTAQAAYEGVQAFIRGGAAVATGVMPDERTTQRIRSELERLGIWSPRIDVTTVDGTVYLRGRETDQARADAIVATLRDLPGVTAVVDELHRE
ncbi:MAG: hypothetical protein QOF51_3914 [Chloroflexota bacterium]|jgi:hypothetical protein|nr:hypothetical protein [Chloroflexota bacterium]